MTRVCSLLPSATEIVCDLGLIDSLVAVSEECRWPPEVASKPHVTAARVDSANLSDVAIDRVVRDSIGSGEQLYTVDAALVDELRPDILITQDLCTVCAVSSADLATACPVGAKIISLDPGTLDEVADTVTLLGERLGAPDAARRIVAEVTQKIETVRTAVAGLPRRRIYVAEWIDPPFCAGHWVPEMVEAAGGYDVMGVAGQPSHETTWDQVLARAPELVIVAPCGFLAADAAERAGDVRLPCPSVAVDADSYYS